MKLISVIVPFYNKWHLTHNTLKKLYDFAPENCEIVLVNDASTEKDCEFGVGWWQREAARHKLRYRRNEENLGFGGSMNVGAKTARGDIFIFLSNDVAIYGDFISQIEDRLLEKPNSLLGGEIINFPGGWNEIEIDGKKSFVPYANGWLLACTREVWESMDGFDPRYGKFDYEDIDLSTQAIAKGYDIIPLGSKLVEHKHQGQTISTLQIDRMAHTKKNREIYLDKWASIIPEINERLSDVPRGSR